MAESYPLANACGRLGRTRQGRYETQGGVGVDVRVTAR